MRKTPSKILLIFLAFCASFLAWAENKSEPLSPVIIDRIICIVGKEPILQSEVAEQLARMKKTGDFSAKDALDALILDSLILQEVKKGGQDVTPEDLERTINSVKKQYNLDDSSLQGALLKQGITFEDYREQLKKQLYKMKLIEAKIKSRVKISDEDIKAAYQAQYASADSDFKVHLLYILFKNRTEASKKRAENAFTQLKSGANFLELSKTLTAQNSKDITSGDFGEVQKGGLLTNFDKYAFTLPQGNFSPPIESDNGYFLVFVDKRIPVAKIPLENVEKDLHKQLYEKEIEQEFSRYIEELKMSAYIQHLDEKNKN